jgi:hypothetical protein
MIPVKSGPAMKNMCEIFLFLYPEGLRNDTDAIHTIAKEARKKVKRALNIFMLMGSVYIR